MKKKSLICAAAVALLAAGCAPKLGGSDYDVKGVGEISKTRFGVIAAKRVVNINASDPSKPGMGAVGGALAGGVGGSMIGQGKGRVLSTGVGALAGAFGGHVLEQYATSQEGFEYQVRMDSGETITISQGAEPNLSVGQRVSVIEGIKGRSRIVGA